MKLCVITVVSAPGQQKERDFCPESYTIVKALASKVEPRTTPACSLTAEPLTSFLRAPPSPAQTRTGRRHARAPRTARPLLNSTVNNDKNACDNNNLILA